MFSFFSKKEFLVDHLEGFVDIHNHILPDIDDGAKNVEESIELIKAFGEFGVKNFICTPHIMHNYYDNTPKTIKSSHKKLKKELTLHGLENVKTKKAAEHMIDANFETILESDKVMPLGDNHILIEMSYLQPSINFEIALKKVQEKQLFPVLAHPERYVYLHKDFDKYLFYKSMGVKFQLNMLSLTNYYGKEIKKVASKLLELGLYDFIGSDAHNLRHLKNIKELTVAKKHLDTVNTLIIQTTNEFIG